MYERFEQYRTYSLACGAVHIAHDLQPQQEGAVRTTPGMVRITRGQNEARIHTHEKKILTGDKVIFTTEDLRSQGATCGHGTDAVAIGLHLREKC